MIGGEIMLGIIFNMHKVRFVDLDNLLGKVTTSDDIDTVNVFINLEPIFRKVATNPDMVKYLKVQTQEKNNEFIAEVINLAAHYRLFFNKARLKSKIYMYFGYPFTVGGPYANRRYVDEYRMNYQEKFTRDTNGRIVGNLINDTVSIISTICNYIDGVYFVPMDYIEPSLLPKFMVHKFGSKSLNLIVTNDRYEYQYVNQGFTIIRVKYPHHYVVTKDNLIQVLKQEEKISNDIIIPPHFISFLLSFMGDSRRNIPRVKNIGLGRLLPLIDKAIKEGSITLDTKNIQLLTDFLKEEIQDVVKNNFYCIDVDIQSVYLGSGFDISIQEKLIDKYDNHSLKLLNEEYFSDHPMMLMELTTELRSKKNIFG